jgi:plasmid stabilization system protein ParE
VTRVEIAEAALRDLDELIRTHSLPRETRDRVRRSLRPLAEFPRMGAALEGRWEGFRFLVGPWRWMIFVYVYFQDEDRVVVLSAHDARSSKSPTSER